MIPEATQRAWQVFAQAARSVSSSRPRVVESGRVLSVGDGIVRASGLEEVKAGEIVQLSHNSVAMVLDLSEDGVGVILLNDAPKIEAGSPVFRTHSVAEVPVGEHLLGRIIDPVGRPLDAGAAISRGHTYPIERLPRPITDRAPVERPLQTGVKSIDALIPIGRGQRQLILGDRQTGKTQVGVDTILNQRDQNMLCVYLAVGQRTAATAQVVQALRKNDALRYTVVMVAGASSPAGLRYLAPYAATSVGEYFMEHGQDVLVVYDDLSKHADTYREMSLLLRRPPGREAFPGDIFYVHSRLLERATQLRPELGGGSLTALPIVETQAQNLSAYIPTNIISITDGQVYLDPVMYSQGLLPAVDIGLSVSRVGGKAQLPAYGAVSGRLRLAYSQFRELEMFARFSTRLDASSQRAIDRGRRLREILKQNLNSPCSVPEQIAVLLAVAEGVFDKLAVEKVALAEQTIRQQVTADSESFADITRKRKPLDDDMKNRLLDLARKAVDSLET